MKALIAFCIPLCASQPTSLPSEGQCGENSGSFHIHGKETGDLLQHHSPLLSLILSKPFLLVFHLFSQKFSMLPRQRICPEAAYKIKPNKKHETPWKLLIRIQPQKS